MAKREVRATKELFNEREYYKKEIGEQIKAIGDIQYLKIVLAMLRSHNKRA